MCKIRLVSGSYTSGGRIYHTGVLILAGNFCRENTYRTKYFIVLHVSPWIGESTVIV